MEVIKFPELFRKSKIEAVIYHLLYSETRELFSLTESI